MKTRIIGDMMETNSVTVMVLTDEGLVYKESRFEYDAQDEPLLALDMLTGLAYQTIGEWEAVVIRFHNA